MVDLFKWFKRPPNQTIGGKKDPYLLRWYLIPKNEYFNIYLHKFLRDDDPRALHDHPWYSLSILLKGGYLEVSDTRHPEMYFPGSIIFRKADFRHRIVLLNSCGDGHWDVAKQMWHCDLVKMPVWSIFITGPKVREWGFWCPKGFVHWTQFTSSTDSSEVGKGCEE